MNKERKHMKIPVELRRKDGAPLSQDALVDSGAEVNIISLILVKELGWKAVNRSTKSVLGFDGHATMSHGLYAEDVTVTDSWQQSRTMKLIFHAVDSDEHAIILGYPWDRKGGE